MKCERCNGTGWIECPTCDGQGEVEVFCGRVGCSNEEAAYEAGRFRDEVCGTCYGDKEVLCPDCNGAG